MSVNFKNASIKNATISTRIVYDSSLVLALDPANPVSYSGTGDSANNLITPDVFTLTNGAGYNSANGGIFTFAGDDDYIESNNSISYSLANGFTLMQWVKLNTYDGGTYSQNLFNNTNNFINFYFGGGSTLRWETHLSNAMSSTSVIQLNTWMFFTGTMSTLSTPYTAAPDSYGIGTARIYLNGVLNSTPTALAASPSTNTNITIGSYTYTNPSTSVRTLLPSNSSIGQTLFYTRELSATEILQNYNALRYRYGV
jgi:hypothetical protein